MAPHNTSSSPTEDGSPPAPAPTGKGKPIFMATHPRACSTAFERVMMTRPDVLTCVHEPFGDAFYYSATERLGTRFGGDTPEMQKLREQSGFSAATYKGVLESIRKAGEKSGKRVFIKDIAHYLIPPCGAATIASSLCSPGSPGEPGNPTVIPLHILRTFQFTFLIRHPRRAIPSYYRCTRPPLSDTTGFTYFLPEEAGYRELRLLLEFLLEQRVVRRDELCVLDADDLLDEPEAAVRRYCERVGLNYRQSMLRWNDGGCEEFDKWKGFHEDAIGSVGLVKREKRKKEKTPEMEMHEWTEKWGKEAAELIRKTVEENLEDYEFLMQFKEVF